MSEEIQILVVDDEVEMRHLLGKVLAKEGYSVETSPGGANALKKLGNTPCDIVVTDLRMLEMDGIEVLRAIKRARPETTVILMTAFGSIDSAVQAMKEGAYHYITKPFKMEELLILLRRALEERQLRQEVRSLRQEVRSRYQLSHIVGKGQAMQEVFELIRKVSGSKSTVLLRGESGTGKELVAGAIHDNSPRKDRPFIAVNCSALPEALLESELFGHVKGAFTGAVACKKGLFEEAQSGTIFLDEICDISVAVQAKLLRAIQEGEIKPVGGVKSIQVDSRLIAATNQNLEEAIRRGKFREDLFYRLNVVSITLPPLRERPEDIPLLAYHFLKKYARQVQREILGIDPEALDLLLGYPWPGNVRELENAIERAIVLGQNPRILAADLPPSVTAEKIGLLKRALKEEVTLAELEREYIDQVLKKTKGHRSLAAKILGIDRRTLYRKGKKYDLGECEN